MTKITAAFLKQFQKWDMSTPKQSRKRRRARSESPDEPRERWRPWRPEPEESSAETDSDEEYFYTRKRKRGKIVSCNKHDVTARADVIPLYDPENSEIFSNQWLNKIEQLGAIHNWSDNMKSYFMQSRLSGIAKVWHASLHNYEMSWTEWQQALLEAFPRKVDYVELLREMLGRRKTVTESMTQYYYTKNALLTRLKINDQNAVACIIDGLPLHMKTAAHAGNYDTPSELYSKFLSVMEDHKAKIPQAQSKSFHQPTNTKTEANGPDAKKTFSCFICNETGHVARRCPKNSFNANKPVCVHCNKIGHLSEKCWHKPSTSTSHTATTSTAKPTTVNLLTGQLWLTFGASLAFLIIGLVRGYSASALPSLEAFDPTLIQNSEQKSWIGSIPPLGAFVGSILSGPLMQRAGRKRTLQMTAPLWAAGWLLLGFAPSFPLILVARFVSGLCVGFSLAPAQVYVSECCDPEIRGQLGSLPTLSMSLGIVISYVAGKWLYWRYLAFFSATFCGALFVLLLPLPESPVWLEGKGLDATASIKWLQLSPRAVAVVKDVELPEKSDATAPVVLPSLFTREVFCSSSVIKPLIVGFALLFFQQFSGIDAVIFFTVEIFESAGSTLDPMMATIIVGIVQLVCNGVSTMLVDRAGRRPLLLLSGAIMCVSMFAMGTASYLELQHLAWLGYLPVASLVVFMVGFSLGFGGLPFVLLGELFPQQYRSQLSAMASAVNLLSMFTVIKSFHVLEKVLTSAGTFWMYACFCAIAFFFVLFMVPETKGKSLAEIEQHFRGEEKSNNVKLQKISTIS